MNLESYFKQPVIDVETTINGLANEVVQFRMDGRLHILKGFNRAASAAQEHHALQQLARHGYPVPQVELFEPDSSYIGKPFIVMQHVGGKTLYDAYKGGDTGMVALFAGLLRDLHALPPQVLTDTLPTNPLPNEIAALRRIGYYLDVVDWLDANQVTPLPVCITHRDYHPWNVLIDDAGNPYVIDWEWEISDPRFDVGWAYMLLNQSGNPEFAEAFRAAYGAVADFDYFEVLAITRWMANVTHSMLDGENLRSDAAADFERYIRPMLHRNAAIIEQHTGVVTKV